MKLKHILLEEFVHNVKSWSKTQKTHAGFEIIEKMGGEPRDYLGNGLFSFALSGIYKNKLVAFKFTPEENKTDIEATLEFDEMKKSSPEEFKEFFQNIYEFSYQEFEGVRFGVFVVELLYPVNPIVLKNMFRNSIRGSGDLNITKDLWDKKVQEVANQASEFHKKKIIELFKKYLIDDYKLSSKSLQNAWSTLNKAYGELVKQRIYSKEELEAALTDFQQAIKYVLFADFAMHSGEDNDFAAQNEMPETAKLLKFLRYLKNEKSMFWQDLHSGNLMMRANKEIVISDVGNFSKVDNTSWLDDEMF